MRERSRRYRNTFGNRKPPIPDEVPALTDALADEATKQTQWKGILKKSRLNDVWDDLHRVTEALAEFLEPAAGVVRESLEFPRAWQDPARRAC